MRTKYVKADIVDDKGNIVVKDQYVEESKLMHTLETSKTPFTPEQKKAFEEKVERMKYSIARFTSILQTGIQPDTKQQLDEYTLLMIELYRDEMQMDLVEDMDLIKFNGQIPKHINVRKAKRCGKVYDRWIARMGKGAFFQLKEDVEEHFRGNVTVDIEPTTGGGKI